MILYFFYFVFTHTSIEKDLSSPIIKLLSSFFSGAFSIEVNPSSYGTSNLTSKPLLVKNIPIMLKVPNSLPNIILSIIEDKTIVTYPKGMIKDGFFNIIARVIKF